MAIIVRIILNAVALAVAAALVGGIVVGGDSITDQTITLLAVGAVFGVVNAVIKPVFQLLSLPLIILTLGLFTFVLNALLLLFTGWVAGLFNLPFEVNGFWSAFLGALVIGVVSFLLSRFVPERREGRTSDV